MFEMNRFDLWTLRAMIVALIVAVILFIFAAISYWLNPDANSSSNWFEAGGPLSWADTFVGFAFAASAFFIATGGWLLLKGLYVWALLLFHRGFG